MFAKLLKYDIKSMSKLSLPCSIAILGAGAVGMILSSLLVIFGMFADNISKWHWKLADAGQFVSTLSDMASALYWISFIGVGAAFIGVCFLVGLGGTAVMYFTVWDFYKSLITDEGYLYFTLPVSPTKLLLSKLISSFLWNIIASFAQLVSALLIASPIITHVGINIIKDILETPSSPSGSTVHITLNGAINWSILGIGQISSIITAIILSIVTMITAQLMYFFAVFLGGVIAKKNKLLVSIGCIIGSEVISRGVKKTVSHIVTIVIMIATIAVNAILVWLLPSFSISATIAIIAPIASLINIAIFGVVGIILFLLTNYLMNKKLNLP